MLLPHSLTGNTITVASLIRWIRRVPWPTLKYYLNSSETNNMYLVRRWSDIEEGNFALHIDLSCLGRSYEQALIPFSYTGSYTPTVREALKIINKMKIMETEGC